MIKILIGGSPCTHWSIAQKNGRETAADGIGWELFKNYLIAKEKFNPDFFLYENNKSAAEPIKAQIRKELGVTEPSLFENDNGVRFTLINSALVSAQNRQRFYVTNFGDIEQPADRGILLKDILETGIINKEKAYCLEPVCVAERGRQRDGKWEQQVEAREGNKTNALTTVQKDNQVAEPIRIGDIGSTSQAHRVYAPQGKSVCLQSGAGGQGAKTGLYATPIKIGEIDPGGQGYRIYSEEGKAVTQTAIGGGLGSNTGLYATTVKPVFIGEIPEHNGTYRNGNQASQQYRIYDTNSKGVAVTTCAITNIAEPATGNQKPIYEVKDGIITVNGKQYPIKLPDGFYIIRKLTVTECCRLQTMPDFYMRAVSSTQGYKGLGNGWTAEVIIHLLQHAKIPLDEEIVVCSMYDGIGTGRYVLDKMGYKNVTYHAYEIDKYAMQVSMSNYPDIIQHGDAFAVRDDDWQIDSITK